MSGRLPKTKTAISGSVPTTVSVNGRPAKISFTITLIPIWLSWWAETIYMLIVIGSLEDLSRDVSLPKELEKKVALIYKNASRLLDLTQL
jgi:hypothetical protein